MSEEARLEEARLGNVDWRQWGPYLSERQWGTVREDYSEQGDAWNYFPHEHARSRAYRWGEDGIAGISDDKQHLCFSLALWNGRDAILKERLFGLTGPQGNHGEDVKELYFYLDNTPTHAYMKLLYKYPQQAFPYERLVEENGRRSRNDFEFELIDTGVFDEGRYFDVFVEYAKAMSDDLLIRITAINRGPNAAELHLLPTLWFRNTWSWGKEIVKPSLSLSGQTVVAKHPLLGTYYLSTESVDEWLFTENETNQERVFGKKNGSPYVKDAFHNYVVQNNRSAVQPGHIGTKAAAHSSAQVSPNAAMTLRLRLTKGAPGGFGKGFEEIFSERTREADAFYQKISLSQTADLQLIQRQAFAGMLWNKQFYHYNVSHWLQEGPSSARQHGRNCKWPMLDASDIFSMPDKWEYPWFAAWDTAFHAVTLAVIDPELAKKQLLLLTKEWYMHPNGQIPAYEWDFSDVNPPVHAWATLRVYQIEEKMTKRKDRAFLEKMFHKLVLNFTWWVNRKDAGDRNLFEGGFLGLDNIGPFDRTKGVPGGGLLYQVDGTGWMGMYCLNLFQIALELANEDPVYEDMATKFFEHFIFIADAMNNLGGAKGLWDEQDGFYHGILSLADGTNIKMNSITLLGIIPLFAVAVTEIKQSFPYFEQRFRWFMEHKPELVKQIVTIDAKSGKTLFSLVSPDKMRRILDKVLDESQLLSPYGIRSVSKALKDHPFVLRLDGQEYSLNYEPAESTTPLFGGNSNWRGPVWFPLNYLLIESLQKFHYFLGDGFKVGNNTVWDVAYELSERLINIFAKNNQGRRPVYGGMKLFQHDPEFRDYLLFHEYFHGDNGAGLGANCQTGWTGLVAKLILQHAEYKKKRAL